MTLNSVVGVSAPATVKQGTVFTANFSARNVGTEVWQPGLHKIGFLNDDAQWGDTRAALPYPVAPNQTATWSSDFVATQAGQRTMSVRMVKEGVAWFGPTASTPINVPATPVAPLAPRSDSYDLLGRMVLNTGPMVCVTGTVRTDVYTNTSPYRMLLKRAKIWVGFDGATKADCHVEVTRSDGSLFVCGQFDHYADGPEGGAREYGTFDPYFALEPGEALIVNHVANPFTLPGAQHYHVTLTLWWQYSPPLGAPP